MNDYLPPDGVSLEDLSDALSTGLELLGGEELETDRAFYDTFDGLLHAKGLALVYEAGRLVLVALDSGDERAALPSAEPIRPLFAGELAPGPLRDQLAEIVEVRALLPVGRIHSRVRALDVLDRERKTVVRVALELSAPVSPSGYQTTLLPRLRLSPVRGYDDQLERIRNRLEHELGYRPAPRPLVDEAIIAAGGTPGGTTAKIDVPLSYDERADRAAAVILRRLLDVIEANLDGTIADIDTEFLHDFRVSVRRSRSVQRELKEVFPPTLLARFRGDFRWLQQITGDSRDLDVYVLEFDRYRAMVPDDMRADLQPLLGVLRGRRLGARREMVRALRSEQATTLLSDWASFLAGLEEMPVDDRPAAALPIGELAGERIRKVYRQMVRMGADIDDSSPPEHYHELRKKGKELRYLLELFGTPLYPAEVVKPMIRALKALQDVLGRHQDREVQVATLRSLRNEVAALPGGPAALMAMGVLVQRLYEDEQAARDEFAARFEEFASREQRRLVKDTFGAG